MTERQVELSDVSFKYEASVHGGIDSLSLLIAKGEFV